MRQEDRRMLTIKNQYYDSHCTVVDSGYYVLSKIIAL